MLVWRGPYVPAKSAAARVSTRHVLDTIQPDAVLVDAEGESVIGPTCRGGLPIAPPAFERWTLHSYYRTGSGRLRRNRLYLIYVPFHRVPRAFNPSVAFPVPGGHGGTLSAMPEDSGGAAPAILSFDISVSKHFTAWNRSGRLRGFPRLRHGPRDFLRTEQFMPGFPPPSVAVFLEQMKMPTARRLPCSALHHVGGDGLPATTAGRWMEAAPTALSENIYGPTEITVGLHLACDTRALKPLTPDAASSPSARHSPAPNSGL